MQKFSQTMLATLALLCATLSSAHPKVKKAPPKVKGQFHEATRTWQGNSEELAMGPSEPVESVTSGENLAELAAYSSELSNLDNELRHREARLRERESRIREQEMLLMQQQLASKDELIAVLRERLKDKEDTEKLQLRELALLENQLSLLREGHSGSASLDEQDAATELAKWEQHEKLDKLLRREQTSIRDQTAFNHTSMDVQLHRVDYLAARLKTVADDVQIDALNKLDASSVLSAPSLEEISTEIFCTAGMVVGAVWKGGKKFVVGAHNVLYSHGHLQREDWEDTTTVKQPGCLCTDATWKSRLSNAAKAMVGVGDKCDCSCCSTQPLCLKSLVECQWGNTYAPNQCLDREPLL